MTFEVLKPGSLTQLDNCVKEISQVQNLTEVGYTNKDGGDRKTSSEGEGQESNNNEEESKPTVLVQIENTKDGGSNRLDSGRGGRKVIAGSKRTTSHIVGESDYVMTSEWRIDTDCKKPKLNGAADEKNGNTTEGQNCIPKRVTKGAKKVSKLTKAKKEAKQAKKELSESTLDTDLENYFIESKKKKTEENNMEVDEPKVEETKSDVATATSGEEKNSENESGVTEKMETDESEKAEVVESTDDKEQWSDKWSDGKKNDEENDDPMTEEEEQTLLDEDAEQNETDEVQEKTVPDADEPEQKGAPEESTSEENASAEPEPSKDATEKVSEETSNEKPEEASEEAPAETSADSLPPLEDADAATNQSDDQKDAIPWQQIVKVSIPEEAIGKTQIRQQDLINKIGKKNYGGKVYYEKGQTEAYLLVTESAKETVAAMTENPGSNNVEIM